MHGLHGQTTPDHKLLAHFSSSPRAYLVDRLITLFFSLLPSLFGLVSSPFTLVWLAGDRLPQTPRGASVGNMSKPQSTNGSESEFEFIETPKAPTPSFEKFEQCGVRTTSVRLLFRARPRRRSASLPGSDGKIQPATSAYAPCTYL
jgi:hypothetical protein